jgi:hypothetical protein
VGLPSFCGDYRDHPEEWVPGDYPMDVPALRAKLTPRTTLVLGEVKDTVQQFREEHNPSPIGFMAVDLDLYSSTAAALSVLDLCPILRHVAIYFDDVGMWKYHQWAGELLAISEFNESHHNMKIDRWRGLDAGRPYHELPWIERMFLCHDLEAITNCRHDRRIRLIP